METKYCFYFFNLLKPEKSPHSVHSREPARKGDFDFGKMFKDPPPPRHLPHFVFCVILNSFKSPHVIANPFLLWKQVGYMALTTHIFSFHSILHFSSLEVLGYFPTRIFQFIALQTKTKHFQTNEQK